MFHGSLFSGIGGFDLAASWMGWTNIFHVEKNSFCREILKHHFPNSQTFEDVKNFPAIEFRGRIDIISGGFPCQPFSNAGNRAGTSDDRYLWPEMFRIIREARPKYVVAENVRGLISWNEGMVLDTVCADLESEGYEVFPVVLPAASVNAPHRRDRIWIVATNTAGGGVRGDAGKLCQSQRRQNNKLNAQPFEHGATRSADATNTNGGGERPQTGGIRGTSEKVWRNTARRLFGTFSGGADVADTDRITGAKFWQEFPTVAPVCGTDDGLPKKLDGLTFQKWRRESIKAYGNAIVPQVAYQIFQAIEETKTKKK